MFVHYNENQGRIVQLKVRGRLNPSSLMCLKFSASAVNNLNIVYSVLTIQNVETEILGNQSRQGDFFLHLNLLVYFFTLFTAFSPTLQPMIPSTETSVGTVRK